jgi:hypothetical protein
MRMTIKGILSYPHLFKVRSVVAGQDPKFSASILIAKDDPQLEAIIEAVETEKANGFPSGFSAKSTVCLKDCVEAFPDNESVHEYYVLNASSGENKRPKTVDSNLQDIMDPAEAYGGAEAHMAVNIFPFTKGKKGIAAFLYGVMLTGQEGALGRLDNSPSTEEMFAGAAGSVPKKPAPGKKTPPAPGKKAPPAPNKQPTFIMTKAADGLTREAYHEADWTDEDLIEQGLMIKSSA